MGRVLVRICTEIFRRGAKGGVAAVGNQVDATFGEGHAADQAFKSEPGAATGAVDRDGFFGVAGAGGVELAVPSQERREIDAVSVHEREKEGGAEGGVRGRGFAQDWRARRSLRSSADRGA